MYYPYEPHRATLISQEKTNMGKQISIYLDEYETQRLVEIARRECRSPHEQARYFLRLILLGDADKVSTQRSAIAPTAPPQIEAVTA
jgi:hypothetical protein